ncbi:MAG: hypothetical protein LBU66_03240 [Treponema sp.]|nr:hypothetical protein [Treponema sp.]
MKTYQSGVLVDEYEDDNLVVSAARSQMARLVAGEAGRQIAKIAFGTNGKAPNPADSFIINQFVKNISSYNFQDERVLFDWELKVTENNGMDILEFGLLTADDILFARKTRANPLRKTADISLEGQWTLIFN